MYIGVYHSLCCYAYTSVYRCIPLYTAVCTVMRIPLYINMYTAVYTVVCILQCIPPYTVAHTKPNDDDDDAEYSLSKQANKSFKLQSRLFCDGSHANKRASVCEEGASPGRAGHFSLLSS